MPVVDTAAMARAAERAPRNTRGEPNLEALALNLGVPVVSPHQALGDAVTTAHVFVAPASRLESRGYRSARDFVDRTAGDRSLAKRRR
ncbi:hypothetical protein TUM20983_38010 [Mycobacterium antarcticum]|uniref:hypothetical protein n=1 Tax=Mycolicibacterium sp. TUM20983 TaxID=3023369 RepID=UPI00239FCD84|nr:hypothetical protein [Mycolicibacterium sp. TUM20983]GLP76691.1 hypothetical protein TUM20983_38010 [Mycolicibacterium sp. TUM20983]